MQPRARHIPIIVALGLAAAPIAAGVTNPNVQDRIDVMKEIAAEMKALAPMAQGTAPFDAEAVAAGMDAIARKAGWVPKAFKARELDPASEASLKIWDDYPAFVEKAEALGAAARGGASAANPAELGAAISNIAGTCRACHESYKG